MEFHNTIDADSVLVTRRTLVRRASIYELFHDESKKVIIASTTGSMAFHS
jgi:hypothetical protein